MVPAWLDIAQQTFRFDVIHCVAMLADTLGLHHPIGAARGLAVVQRDAGAEPPIGRTTIAIQIRSKPGITVPGFGNTIFRHFF